MRTNKFLSVPVLLLTSMFLFTSCKKDNGPEVACNIITATPTSGDVLNFTYNADGRVASHTRGNFATTFSYSGNTIIANSTYNGGFDTKSIITIGSNGFASNVKTEGNISGTDWSNNAYDYSGNQLVKQTGTSSQNAKSAVTTLTWSGGDIVAINTDGKVSTIEYYSNIPAQEGDYMDIIQKSTGYRLYKTKHAMRSILNGNSITNVEYAFEDGRISNIIFKDGSTTTSYGYQWQCN